MRVGVSLLLILCLVTVPESLCLGLGIGLGEDFPGFGGGLGSDGFDFPGFGDAGVELPGLGGGGGLLSVGSGGGFRGALRGTVPNPSSASAAPTTTETSSTPPTNPSGGTQGTTTDTPPPPPPAAATGGESSTPTCSATQTLLVGVCVDCISRIPGCTTCSTSTTNEVTCNTCITGLTPNLDSDACVIDPDACSTAITGCETCDFQNPNVVCTMCDSGFALDVQANPATFCIPCSVVDNCLTCSDTPETAEPPNFGVDDVSCDTCDPPFDPQGGACVVSSDP